MTEINEVMLGKFAWMCKLHNLSPISLTSFFIQMEKSREKCYQPFNPFMLSKDM
jgi:hypothetical protein